MSRGKHPAILQLEEDSWKAPKVASVTFYRKSAQSLIEQADIAFLEEKNEIAYQCYYAFCILYREHKNDFSKDLASHVSGAISHLEELVPRIIAQYEREQNVGNQQAGNGEEEEEDELTRRLRQLDMGGSSSASSKPVTRTTPTAAATRATRAPDDTFSRSYNEARQKPSATSTIGLDTSLGGVSQRLLDAGKEYKADSLQNRKNEQAYKLSEVGIPSTSVNNPLLHPQDDPDALPQDPNDLYQQYGVSRPDIARDAPKAKTYTDSILHPTEKAKYSVKRRMHLPTTLIRVFLQEAEADLSYKVETCGILFGHEYHGELVVKGLVIPEQSGESDKCCTKHEERLIDVIQTRGYIILGWIHTHPQWDPFLSSIDLHCQAAYQQSLPEAIAIVCSPHKSLNCMFTLSEQGLSQLRSCSQSAQKFHAHNETVPLFTNASHVTLHYPPGHERHHEVSDVLVPPPPESLTNRLANWITQEGLKRYECQIVDMRRGKGLDRWYIWPEREENGATGHRPSGGRDIPRVIKKKPAPVPIEDRSFFGDMMSGAASGAVSGATQYAKDYYNAATAPTAPSSTSAAQHQQQQQQQQGYYQNPNTSQYTQPQPSQYSQQAQQQPYAQPQAYQPQPYQGGSSQYAASQPQPYQPQPYQPQSYQPQQNNGSYAQSSQYNQQQQQQQPRNPYA